jgi:hypothetical protein
MNSDHNSTPFIGLSVSNYIFELLCLLEFDTIRSTYSICRDPRFTATPSLMCASRKETSTPRLSRWRSCGGSTRAMPPDLRFSSKSSSRPSSDVPLLLSFAHGSEANPYVVPAAFLQYPKGSWFRTAGVNKLHQV